MLQCSTFSHYVTGTVLHSHTWIREIDMFIPVRKTFIMSIAHIHREHRNPETRKTLTTFLVQVRNFLLPLSLKVFRHKERDTIFLCWLFHLPQTTCAPATRPRRASESQPSSSQAGTQLNWLCSNFSPRFRIVTAITSLVISSIWDFYCDISEWHVRSARAWKFALMFAPN